jgi:branched-chain amino acid transport system permease protein
MTVPTLPAVVVRHRETLLLVVGLAIATAFIKGNSVWLDTSVYTAIYAIIALSIGISYGQAGILSAAQAAFAAMGAYASAIISIRYDQSPYLGLLAAVALPAVVGYPLARVVTRLSHLALAIATLVFGSIVTIVIRESGSFTGGFIGLSGVPKLSIAPTALRYHLLAWGIVVVVVVIYRNLMPTAHGRSLRTIRHDPLLARADGVDVSHSLAMTFAISSALAGSAGWLYVHYISFIAPDSLPPQLSIDVILMAVIGGVSFATGPVVGAIVLGIFQTYLPAKETKGLLYGGALVFVLLVAPEGILGLISGALKRRRRPSKVELTLEAEAEAGVPAGTEVTVVPSHVHRPAGAEG